MYGVPEDLDLTQFIGTELIQLYINQNGIGFEFHPTGYIFCEGKWEAFDHDGEMIDHGSRELGERRSEYRVHRLLGKCVARTKLDPPESFSMIFEDGSILRVFDDSKQYESITIPPSGIFI